MSKKLINKEYLLPIVNILNKLHMDSSQLLLLLNSIHDEQNAIETQKKVISFYRYIEEEINIYNNSRNIIIKSNIFGEQIGKFEEITPRPLKLDFNPNFIVLREHVSNLNIEIEEIKKDFSQWIRFL